MVKLHLCLTIGYGQITPIFDYWVQTVVHVRLLPKELYGQPLKSLRFACMLKFHKYILVN